MLSASRGICLLDRGRDNHVGWNRLGIYDKLKMSELGAVSRPSGYFFLRNSGTSRVKGSQLAVLLRRQPQPGARQGTLHFWGCHSFCLIAAYLFNYGSNKNFWPSCQPAFPGTICCAGIACAGQSSFPPGSSPRAAPPSAGCHSWLKHLAPRQQRQKARDTKGLQGDWVQRGISMDWILRSKEMPPGHMSLPPESEQTYSTCPLNTDLNSVFNL